MPWRLFGRGEKDAPSEGSPDSLQGEGDAAPPAEGRFIQATVRAKTILVPVDDSAASLEAVALGCSLARRQKGKVYVVHIIEVPRSLALDAELEPESAHGEELLQVAEQVAHKADYQVEGELLQVRDAGQAVVDEAVSQGVELIIMGMEYQQPMGEFQMSRIHLYVLKNAPCEVWIIRRPPTGQGSA